VFRGLEIHGLMYRGNRGIVCSCGMLELCSVRSERSSSKLSTREVGWVERPAELYGGRVDG
jgi:hypothetical protein